MNDPHVTEEKFIMTYTNTRFNRAIPSSRHRWITVVNPANRRMLLQACDDCGVVKSENSVERGCKAAKGSAVISRALSNSQQWAV